MPAPEVLLDEPGLRVTVQFDDTYRRFWITVHGLPYLEPGKALPFGIGLAVIELLAVLFLATTDPAILPCLVTVPIALAIFLGLMTRRKHHSGRQRGDRLIAERVNGDIPLFGANGSRHSGFAFLSEDQTRRVFELVAPEAAKHGIHVMDRVWGIPEYEPGPEPLADTFVGQMIEIGDIPEQEEEAGWRCGVCAIINFDDPPDPDEKDICWGCGDERGTLGEKYFT